MAAPVIEGTYTATSSGAETWDITGVVIPSGLTDGLLVVGNSYEYGNSGNESLVTSVVIDPGGANEAAFTRAVNASVFGSYGNESSLWYLADANIPPAGTYTVRVTTDLPSGNAYTVYAASGCYVLSGASQSGIPDATASQTATTNSGLTTNITTVAADTLVLDSYSQGDDNAPTANSGQTVQWDLASGTSRGTSSSKALTSAGTTSLGYTHASSNRVAHSVASFAALSGGAIIDRLLTDTIDTSDSIGIQNELSRMLQDSVSVLDQIIRGHEWIRLLQDDIGTSDEIAIQRLRNRLVNDSIIVADAISRQFVLSRLLSDSVNVSDSLTSTIVSAGGTIISRVMTDAISVQDALDAVRERSRQLADAVDVTDSIRASREIYRILTDAIETADAIRTMIERNRVLSDLVDVQDSIIRQVIFFRQMTDSVEASDLLMRSLILERIVNDTINVFDQLLVNQPDILQEVVEFILGAVEAGKNITSEVEPGLLIAGAVEAGKNITSEVEPGLLIAGAVEAGKNIASAINRIAS